MKETRIMMGMPITVEVIGGSKELLVSVFDYFNYIDQTFSTYKDHSEIMRINRGELKLYDASPDMQLIFKLAEQTKRETGGYFDIVDRKGQYDPSGIVKGWAIWKAAGIIEKAGFKDYYVDAGGDIQVGGHNRQGQKWNIGIKNPFKQEENVKIVQLSNGGIATSGTYIRGQHIYDPHKKTEVITDIVSLSVIGPNIYEADRFATAAFAMGRKGIEYIERLNIEGLEKLEAYMIDSKGLATMTSNFEKYV